MAMMAIATISIITSSQLVMAEQLEAVDPTITSKKWIGGSGGHQISTIQYNFIQDCKPSCNWNLSAGDKTTENREMEIMFALFLNDPNFKFDSSIVTLGPLQKDIDTTVYLKVFDKTAKKYGWGSMKIGKKLILPAWENDEYKKVKIVGEKGDFITLDLTKKIQKLLDANNGKLNKIRIHIGQDLDPNMKDLQPLVIKHGGFLEYSGHIQNQEE